MEQGSLANILSDKVKATELGWRKRVNIVKGLADALSCMHHECSHAMVHRDISSNNVLLDPEYEAHLADFGTARILVPESSSNWNSFACTFGYSASAWTWKGYTSFKNFIDFVRKDLQFVIDNLSTEVPSTVGVN
ncbi:MDIS1-interacting receptor like kinase 2-like [Ziziphus jujuba]|uniref:non-specific serine/threonine protein kinase n=1 Tax=Ziziphus jujuba TaxID=326968 RepID=A0A6P3YX27_ZIZJJ|nr:MDIS1-interacting receptor like kinase 2-like [Ziziphus jujuba]